ncbi:MAG: phage tail protein, partial [Candidatus Paceibacterota bacterium]
MGLDVSVEEAEKSIFLDGTPLRNSDGVENFDLDGMAWSFVPGTQHQSVLPVSSGNTATEVAVSQQVKAGNTGGGPVVRTINEQYIDAARVTVRIPTLYQQNTTNGDTSGTSVSFAIDVQSNGGGFVQVMAPTISGKTSSDYRRSYEFDLPGSGPWDIRVRRVTADTTSMALQNDLYFESYTKIVKEEFSYPNSAAIGIKIDSGLFSSVPTRGYLTDLMLVRVPDNYDPISRTYTGLWSGSFKVAWTDNPAWCWYDLIASNRYGLGDYIDAATVDKWALYEIAQYCDELVPDGFGGMEPRFTCNLFLQAREEALRVLMNMASIFRGITYWHSNSILCSQDRPADPVKLFTAANVINGVFTYSGTARLARHTVALVSWNDPDNLYKQTVEYVEDREGIARFGIRDTEVVAFGCTSRGQAHRFGLWSLITEREETDTVSFQTALEGAGLMPGDIIQTSDSARSGKRMGGRIVSGTASQITIDSEVTLEVGKSYTLTVMLPSGASQERAVIWSGASDVTTRVVSLTAPLDQAPQQHAVWVLSTDTLETELWRVMSVTEAEPGILEVTALEHIPGKYALVEEGLALVPRLTSSINLVPSAVTNVVTKTEIRQLNTVDYSTRIAVSWSPEQDAARYLVTWRRDTDNQKETYVTVPSYDIDDVAAGTYTITITPENGIGRRGPVVSTTHVVDQSLTEPDVQNIRLYPDFSGADCPITWDAVPTAVSYLVSVYDGATKLREVSTTTTYFTYTYGMNVADGGPIRTVTFKISARSMVGSSASEASFTATNEAPAVAAVSLEAGPGQIGVSAARPADQDLVGMIVWMSTSAAFTVSDINKVYQGSDNAFMKTGLQPGIQVYFKVAFYDRFGVTGLNVSSAVGATPTATGGVLTVTSLPADPAAVNGEVAVFLDVVDTSTRGLYGWDGSAWQF